MRNTDDRQLEELLGKAFTRQYENELNNGPADDDLAAMHPFTEEQMKKAEALSRKHKKRGALWAKGLGKAAAVILCIATAAGVLSMTDPTVRANLSHAVTHFVDDFISVDFSDAAEDGEIDIASTRVTYIPEGYKLETDNSDENTLSHIYQNDNGEFILIDVETSSDIRLLTENDAHDFELTRINGYEAYISYSEDMTQGSVYFGNSYFTVAISGMTERDELIKIAENIVFKD